jgi:hypothetical protein
MSPSQSPYLSRVEGTKVDVTHIALLPTLDVGDEPMVLPNVAFDVTGRLCACRILYLSASPVVDSLA